MSEIPQSKDDIHLGHTIVHYTFFPVLGGVLAGIVSPIVLWPLGYISLGVAFVIPWVAVLACCAYFAILGEYVIPSETYRKVRSGEWGESDE